MSRKNSGFTLVELLVVIGIIALLISVLLPALGKARAAASTITCAARMRQVTTAAVMYANDNRGVLPPIVCTYKKFLGTLGNRPTIFPAGGEGYINKYLMKQSDPAKTTISTAKLFNCPEIESTVGDNFASVWSYRYNAILGGLDKHKLQAAYGGAWNDGSNHLTLPWKLSQVRQSTNVALWAEGDAAVSAISHSAIALDTEPAKNANGLFAHNPRYGIFIHSRRAAAGGIEGVTNVGYCDGSVRSVSYKVDALYPKRQFEDTWINPYQVGNSTGWPVDTVYH